MKKLFQFIKKYLPDAIIQTGLILLLFSLIRDACDFGLCSTPRLEIILPIMVISLGLNIAIRRIIMSIKNR